MSIRRAAVIIAVPPEDVVDALATPDICRSWCPLPIDLEPPTLTRLAPGSAMTVRGRLGGRAVAFALDVLDVGSDCVALRATGPLVIEATYRLAPAGGSGTRVDAEIRTCSPRGATGRLLAAAADALLRAGLLETALRHIDRLLSVQHHAEPAHA